VFFVVVGKFLLAEKGDDEALDVDVKMQLRRHGQHHGRIDQGLVPCLSRVWSP
jgi:hypothetical protein